MQTIAILASWNVSVIDGRLFLPSTHYVYLEFISKQYERVYLISTISINTSSNNASPLNLDNVEFIKLPHIDSYVQSILKFNSWYRAIKSVNDCVDVVYCRVPDPFSWMPRLLFGKKTIMHFVGDTIDATKHNEKWSWIKKQLMIAGYLPDYALTLLASRRSRVYTNGHHIANKLAKYGIKATSLISSTVQENTLTPPNRLERHLELRLIYVGYIRYAKGINTIMNLCSLLVNENIDFKFDIIGDGEMFVDLQKFVLENNLEERVILHGRINDRKKINNLLRANDLFIFPSLSEGSPRVVIEAMSQGTPVISTPVGSLPSTFIDGETIRYFDFHNAVDALSIIKEYITSPEPFIKQRDIAYERVVNNYTIEAFLNKIFDYNT